DFFFQAEDGIRDFHVTGVQTCALPIFNVPYIDETTSTPDAAVTPNDTDIYPKIVEDLEFAVANLPVGKPKGEVGRVNKIAAQAYLGKVLLYQNKHAQALSLFETVINSLP